ncbi:MAG: S8 family serine peptidase, partial [Stackebrandtia sp.]
AIDHGAKVVNISLGGERTTDAPWKKQLIDYAISKDVVLIAAAGNTGDGDKRVAEPAAIPGVVAVSGVGQDGRFWEGSAKGPEVVVSAPAEGLPNAVPTSVATSGYALADGTSGATALVSGVAALIRSAFPDISADDVINRLIHTVEDRGAAGRDPEYGYGVVDARAALEGDVPGAKHHPLVSPEPDKSGAAAGAARDTGNGVLIVLGVFGGTTLLLLVVVYLVVLSRRSRQVVVAGMAPGVASMQVAGGALWRPVAPGPGSWPPSGPAAPYGAPAFGGPVPPMDLSQGPPGPPGHGVPPHGMPPMPPPQGVPPQGVRPMPPAPVPSGQQPGAGIYHSGQPVP